jgi:hypothetical protein
MTRGMMIAQMAMMANTTSTEPPLESPVSSTAFSDVGFHAPGL